MTTKPIAIYYEHPEWFRPLFELLDQRGIPYIRIDAASHQYDPKDNESEYSLLFNRMSASAYLRSHGNALFYTRDFLEHLERIGVRVINGKESFATETSKARQLDILESLGLSYPRTRVVNSTAQVIEAANAFNFPLVVKPNIGGRGAGIVRYDSLDALVRAAETEAIDFGPDHVALVQEFIPARGGHITRVETLGGKYLYAIRVFPTGESFNLCPAEICQTEDQVAAVGESCLVDASTNGLRVEACTPTPDVIESVERIAEVAKLDLGGVEFIVDDRDARLLYYDINALSNFVADAPRILGFDPHDRLVDFLKEEASKCATVTGSRSLAVG
jgi:glutathione synthase/RimK-type ligase-like ATP-grasp enzyme